MESKDETKEEIKETEAGKLYLDEPTGEMVSKNEHKKRQKQRKKEEDNKEKEAKKAAQLAAQPVKKAKVEEELDPSKYTENRKQWI